MSVKLIFKSSDKSGVDSEMECFCNDQNEIFISILDSENIRIDSPYICLDKSTAIKFSKVLRSEISKIVDFQ